MTRLAIISIEHELGIVLPAEMLAKLQADVGDVLLARETAGGFEILSHEGEVRLQLEIAETVLEDDRETLRLLANS